MSAKRMERWYKWWKLVRNRRGFPGAKRGQRFWNENHIAKIAYEAGFRAGHKARN